MKWYWYLIISMILFFTLILFLGFGIESPQAPVPIQFIVGILYVSGFLGLLMTIVAYLSKDHKL